VQGAGTVDRLVDGKLIQGKEGTLQFIHVGKAGGKSVKDWFEVANLGYVEYHVGDLGDTPGPPTESDVKLHSRWLIAVRDPITRIESCFDYENPNGPDRLTPGWVKRTMDQPSHRESLSKSWLTAFYKGPKTKDGCFEWVGDFVDALGENSTCGELADRSLSDPNTGSQHFAKGIDFYIGLRPESNFDGQYWTKSTKEIASLLRKKDVYVVHMETLAQNLAGLSDWLGQPIDADLPIPVTHSSDGHRALSHEQIAKLRTALKRDYDLLSKLGVERYEVDEHESILGGLTRRSIICQRVRRPPRRALSPRIGQRCGQ